MRNSTKARTTRMELLPSLCVILAIALYCFGQNNNSSSGPPTNRQTKRKVTKKESPPKLDLSTLDELLHDMKEWPPVANTTYSSISYGAKTIIRLNKNVVRVWTKTTLNDDTNETKSEFLRIRKTRGARTIGYEHFSHTFELQEYNCTKREGRVLSQVDYDDKGNVIDSTSYRNPGWDYIVPDSIGESILRAVCKPQKMTASLHRDITNRCR